MLLYFLGADYSVLRREFSEVLEEFDTIFQSGLHEMLLHFIHKVLGVECGVMPQHPSEYCSSPSVQATATQPIMNTRSHKNTRTSK